MLATQIAVGIWMGGLFLIGTGAVYFKLTEKIERNRRNGYPWWRDLHRAFQ